MENQFEEQEEPQYENEEQVNEENNAYYYQQPPVEEEKKSSNTWLIVLLSILVVAEAAAIGYLIYDRGELNDKLVVAQNTATKKTEETESKTAELETMRDQFLAIQEESERMGQENAQLKADIEQLNSIIAQAQNSGMSESQIKAKFQGQINKLKKELARQSNVISEQKKEIARLNTDNQTLYSEKTKLNDSLGYVANQKEELSKQIEAASVLKAENFVFSTLTSKGKEYSGNDFNGKNMSKFRIAFNFADNKVAKKNKKTIYFAIMDPNNETFTDYDMGGGSTTVEGDSKAYTAKMVVDFDNSQQRLALVYEKGSDYTKGRYRIHIFCDGHKIGESNFLVK